MGFRLLIGAAYNEIQTGRRGLERSTSSYGFEAEPQNHISMSQCSRCFLTAGACPKPFLCLPGRRALRAEKHDLHGAKIMYLNFHYRDTLGASWQA
eukprot:gene26131-biopygen14240